MYKPSLFLIALLFISAPTLAQTPAAVHVVKSDINAEAEKAELCLEFDHALATPQAKLNAALALEVEGKKIALPTLAATGTSLCLFPLERGKEGRLTVTGLRGEGDSRMEEPYSLSFTIPDRSPSLAFTGKNGGVNGFGAADAPLTLRAVNVAHAALSIYRVGDAAAMTQAWQNRAQTALAPTESAYLARDKGQQVWQGEQVFAAPADSTAEAAMTPAQLAPDLGPGLYLLIADAAQAGEKAKPASKGLTPLAAAWFVKSDFRLRALRDADGIHVIADRNDGSAPKDGLHLAAMTKKPEMAAEAAGNAGGVTLIAWPQNISDKNDISTIMATDATGDVGFADIETLPMLAATPALGAVGFDGLFALPGDDVVATATLTPSENMPSLTEPSLLRIGRGGDKYADIAVPALTADRARVSFPAPAAQGLWTASWRKNDGTLLADTALRVTANADMPRLEVGSDRDMLGDDAVLPVTIKSVTSSGAAAALTGGHVSAAWQALDPQALGWKDYRFGVPAALADKPVPVADFLTDMQGIASLRLTLPSRPAAPGLYQAVVTAAADADAGIATAPPLIMPLRPDATVIGIKPLSPDARFTQNGIARFALIGIGSDGKPRDVGGLSYQLYEEGRSFDWYQDQGHWTYKPEPQLRPIGGGDIALHADRDAILEWPVTAGNYRLEILDAGGKILAQTGFSAGWDSRGVVAPTAALNIEMPKIVAAGVPVMAHVMLPQAAMLSVIIADTHIRTIIHEARQAGDNVISFTPGADWLPGVSVSAQARMADGAVMRGVAEAAIAQDKLLPPATGGIDVTAMQDPAALDLHRGDRATVIFAVENKGDMAENVALDVTATPGLKIEQGGKGALTIGARQSRQWAVTLAGESVGDKQLRLDLSGKNMPRLTRSWAMQVVNKDISLQSGASVDVEAGKALFAGVKPRHAGEEIIALAARRPMAGLAEILSYAFNARPFTTAELAWSVDALRQWGDVLAQVGIAPQNLVAARRHLWLTQLLSYQNPDGGFGSLRGAASDMENTAAALTALGNDGSASVKPARDLAVAWVRQRLANTWYDDKERAGRAACYAALAAADAIDAASLHYFSDTSARLNLPAAAEADMAAAFKHIGDPNAAAFWIKKMLDENPHAGGAALLNALAATDALSSDDVHEEMAAMRDTLNKGDAPDIAEAAQLLRAIAADNRDAGKWRLGEGAATRDSSGVIGLRIGEAAAATYRNAGDRSISVTLLTPAERGHGATKNMAVARHIYRLNGVELSPTAKPARDEIYLVELKGKIPAADGGRVLIQDGDVGLRPVGCPLSPRLERPAFTAWLNMDDLTPVASCVFSAHELNAVVAADDSGGDFTLGYFAHVDAAGKDMGAAAARVAR